MHDPGRLAGSGCRRSRLTLLSRTLKGRAAQGASLTTGDAFPRAQDRMSSEPFIRILVVEDHEDSLAATAKLLRRSGYEVVTGRTLSEARAAAAVNRCDLVICDQGLPDGMGTDLLRELRDIYKLKGIVVTGYGSEGEE